MRFELAEAVLPPPLSVPWPSDLYRDADNTVADGLDWSEAHLRRNGDAYEVYGALSGFGRMAGALFQIDRADGEDVVVDRATLPLTVDACTSSGASAFLLDMEAEASAARVRCVADFTPAEEVIAVVPADVLSEGRRYVAVLTTDARTIDNEPVGATAEFRRLRDLAPAERATPSERLYGEAVDRVVELTGIGRDLIAGIAPFTTHGETSRLVSLQEAVLAQPAPRLTTAGSLWPMLRFGAIPHPGWTGTLPQVLGTPPLDAVGDHLSCMNGEAEDLPGGFAHDALAAMLSVSMPSPRFTRDYRGDGGRADGTIEWDASGSPLVVEEASEVPVYFFFPRSAPPAEGYPVVIFQHGLNQSRAAALSVANELARVGIVTVAISAPGQGLRAQGATDSQSPFGDGTYAGPDGRPDGSPVEGVLWLLGDLRNLLAARDNLWQGVADLVQLRRLLTSDDLDLSMVTDAWSGTAPTLDPSRIGYLGISLGSVLGTMLAAVEPRSSVDPFVLSVPPGGLFSLTLPDSPGFAGAFQLVLTSAGLPLTAFDNRARTYPQVAQGILDSADAGSFAARAVAGPDGAGHTIWMVGALHDTLVSRRGSDALARAFGAIQITPTVRSVDGLSQRPAPFVVPTGAGTAAYFETAPGGHRQMIFRYDRLEHAFPWPREQAPRFPPLAEPFLVRTSCIGAQRAVAHFLSTAWEGAPEIDVGAHQAGFASIADFDDDGHCDDDEAAAGTDPQSPTSVPAGDGACEREVGFPRL